MKTTWWLSFADPDRPKGTQFLGVSIVDADSFLDAVRTAHALGINPGGEVQGSPFPPPLRVPDKFKRRLLSWAEAEEAEAAISAGDA